MAELFGEVFKPRGIYDILFFNVKSVLIYSTLFDLEKNNRLLYNHWEYLSKTKYNVTVENTENLQKVYEQNAPYYPEFSKIVAITYATVYYENTLKRKLERIANHDEFIVLSTFMDELYRLSSEGVTSTPEHFPILCGHNIKNYDIPLLIKKFIFYRNRFETNKQIPYILKRTLDMKPWDTGVIDTVNVWKFNGYDNATLMLISDFMGLKKTVEVLSPDELSRHYWKNYDEKPEDTLDFVSLQSATQTNLVIQLMNELRQR